MPLPLIPVLLGGAALASAAFGVKKGYDAYNDNQEAQRYVDEANLLCSDASKKLAQNREELNKGFKELGEMQIDIIQNELERAKKVLEASQKERAGLNVKVGNEKISTLGLEINKYQELSNGLLTSSAAGAAAGFGAYGAVGTLATASTGTAIGGLSGAAATNATLAWLGGGSLATGGLGVAGGTAVLGGIVAGPAIAIGALYMAHVAEEKKAKAEILYETAQAYGKIVDVEILALKGVKEECVRKMVALDGLRKLLKEPLEIAEAILKIYGDFSKCPSEHKTILYLGNIYDHAKSICEIIDAPIMGSNNPAVKELESAQQDCSRIVKEINSIADGLR